MQCNAICMCDFLPTLVPGPIIPVSTTVASYQPSRQAQTLLPAKLAAHTRAKTTFGAIPPSTTLLYNKIQSLHVCFIKIYATNCIM
jgi:hypothetical protein